MITAVAGAGGKTSLIRELADRYREEGKTVFVTTSTHMFIEEHTLGTDDAEVILAQLQSTGFVMAGIPEGPKIRSLSRETYNAACRRAQEVLVEADGSKHMPLKFPNSTEPVIPENADRILVVCGLHALGQKAKDCCHRLELAKQLLDIDDDTIITPEIIKKLLEEGYRKPLRRSHPGIPLVLIPRHDGSRKAIAEALIKWWDSPL